MRSTGHFDLKMPRADEDYGVKEKFDLLRFDENPCIPSRNMEKLVLERAVMSE
jgi:hypothetical protein